MNQVMMLKYYGNIANFPLNFKYNNMIYFNIEKIEEFLKKDNPFIRELVQLMIKNALINNDTNSIEQSTLYKCGIIVDTDIDDLSIITCDEEPLNYNPNIE